MVKSSSDGDIHVSIFGFGDVAWQLGSLGVEAAESREQRERGRNWCHSLIYFQMDDSVSNSGTYGYEGLS